jgi:hypothetical protein
MSQKTKLAIGITISAIVLALTVAAVVLHEGRTGCGYKTINDSGEMTDECTAKPIRWCSSNIEVRLDDNASQLAEALQLVLSVYQPYTVPLDAWDNFPSTDPTPAGVIRISVSETLDPDVEGHEAVEVSKFNSATGCMILSEITMMDDITWYEEEIILCHEFGHALGLTHASSGLSPMRDPPAGLNCSVTERSQNALSFLMEN